MSLPDLTLRHSACLQRLAERTEAVLELAFARVMAAKGRDVLAETALFSDLGRALRLTLALEMRLANLTPVTASAAARLRPDRLDSAERPEEAEPLERGELLQDDERPARADQADRLVFERERERESDGHPATTLGRAEALEALLVRSPQLDPDGRATAEIIQIKAFLTDAPPEPPDPRSPEPPQPRMGFDASPPAPSRSLNRAERRQLKRRSG